jgi:3-hydroxybutyryl-CoA dehydrogenase
VAIHQVGVVGAGIMGAGIAEVCARAELPVLIAEVDALAAEVGRARIESSLSRAVRAGKLGDDDRRAALARIDFTIDLGDLADMDLVIEAIVEREQAKTELFAQLDKIVGDDAVLASNTSSIPIATLAMATSRPQRVIGLHFFNPVPVLSLVELIPSVLTWQTTQDRVREFAAQTLRKTVVLANDRAGFVVNALLIPYLLAAIRMFESGFATAADIDNAMTLGCAHPMGPLALADLIGLDTVRAVADSMYEEFKEPLYAPPPLLLRMTDAGWLGKKTSRGFHQYPPRQ